MCKSKKSIIEVLKKIKFCDDKNIEMSFSAEEFENFYWNKEEELTSIDFNHVYIVKISKEVTEEELIILRKFFNLISTFILQIDDIDICSGATFYYQDGRFQNVDNIIADLKEEQIELEKELTKFELIKNSK